MSRHSAAWLAWPLCVLILALIAGALVLATLNRTIDWGMTSLVTVVSLAVVGSVIASRHPANPVGWFFAGGACGIAFQEFAFEYATYGLRMEPGALPLAWAVVWLLTWLPVPSSMLLFSFLPLYFPNGRLVSSRWRWVIRLATFFLIAIAIYSAFIPGEIRDSGFVNPLGIEALQPVANLLDTPILVTYLAIIFVSVASLVVRFRQSRGDERQQLKWFTYAATAIPVWFLISFPVEAASPILFSVVETLIFAGIPVAAGIAILKYRLYDIDVLINRTLVYGTLTVLLVVVYWGGVIALQQFFQALTGQKSQLAIVASTLAIAALFNPLRQRIQAFIDRRFYRHKYDAAQVLAAFAATARDEVDLDRLAGELLAVVEETLQPEHVSLWLREPERNQEG